MAIGDIMNKMDYVTAIDGSMIQLTIESQSLHNALKDLGAKKKLFSKNWTLECHGPEERLKIINKLMSLELAFEGGSHGWPPSEILCELRDKGEISGNWIEITWRGPDDPVFRER